jgi:hypothetical protein
MKKRVSRLTVSSLILIAVCLMIGTFAFITFGQKASELPAGAAGINGTTLSSGMGVVLGSNSVRTQAQDSGDISEHVGQFDGADLFSTNTTGGRYRASRTELEYLPNASGDSIRSIIKFSSNYNDNNFYNAMLGGLTGDFVTTATLNFNISVISGPNVPVVITFAWSANGTTEQTKVISATLDMTNYPVEMSFDNALGSTGLNANAYFKINIQINGTGTWIRLSNIVIETATSLTDAITFRTSSVFEISGSNKRDVALDTFNKNTPDYINQLADTYVKTGDKITLRTKVFRDGDTTTCYQLPAIYTKVFGNDSRYGVYWQQYSTSLNVVTGDPEDNLDLKFLSILAEESGYTTVIENSQPVTYYQISFQVDSGVRNIYQLVIVPQLLVTYDKDGPSCVRGTASISQDPLRINVDGRAPSAPEIDPDSVLGTAIANGNWFIDSDSVLLSYIASTVPVQSREYVYAFVCEDPMLLTIDYSDYDFTPLLYTSISYNNRNNEPKQSDVRQELIYYNQISPGRYTQKTRPITFRNKQEQALVLFRIDAAGNVSVPKIYYTADGNPVKVDSTYYNITTSFLIGSGDEGHANELLGANHTKAAYRECFWGPTYHTADGTFLGVTSYGYGSDKEVNMKFKMDQWLTIRISVTSAQAAAYKLIRYRSDEAGINESNNEGIVFNPGSTGRPDYIDITFKLTKEYMDGVRAVFFYFRKSLNITTTSTEFVFNGRSQGLEDYIEAYEGTTMITGLSFNTVYYEPVRYSVEPTYINGVMQDYGSVVIGSYRYNYTGLLSLNNTIIIAGQGSYHILQMTQYVVNGQTIYQTTMYKEGSGLNNGLVDVGEYYYTITIDVTTTTLYFGTKSGYYKIIKANPQVTGLYSPGIVYGESLDDLSFISQNASGADIINAKFNIKGVDYFETKSGVLGTYEIIYPAHNSLDYMLPNVSSNMRVEVRFNPIALTDTAVFTQQVIHENFLTVNGNPGPLHDYYDYVNGVYVLKKGMYHSGNFDSTTHTIYITVMNAEADLEIEGINAENTLVLDYTGTYKDIVFITRVNQTVIEGLPVRYYYNPYVGGYIDEGTVYNNIMNAGEYRITYYIDASACNYMSSKILFSKVIIEKRELELTPVNYNSIPPETYAQQQFDKYYTIKYGKTNAQLLPKPTANIPGGGTLNVAYVYSYMQVKYYNGDIVPESAAVYSQDYTAAMFPKDLEVGTYALRIRVNDANNEGTVFVLLVIQKALITDISQPTPRLNSEYAVYNKDGSLQSYLGDSTQGHIEYGQTIEDRKANLLSGVSDTATYVLAGVSTTIYGRFLFETESEICARYNVLYASDPSGQVILHEDYLGRYILPVRYDAYDNRVVSSYSIRLFWQAGEWHDGVFVPNINFDLMEYSVSLVVARATADLSRMSFTPIIYGTPFGAGHTLIGKPVAPATGYPEEGYPDRGMANGTYTIRYDASYASVIFSKGIHEIPCTFTPVDVNNYRPLTNIRIPLTVNAMQAYVELGSGISRELTYGNLYTVPECRIYYMNGDQKVYLQGDIRNMLEYVYTRNGQTVNISSNLGMTTYVSAMPASDYVLTVNITSNDYMGNGVFDNFVIHRGTLSILSNPTQEVVEYGVLIADIDFYNGQVQNPYTRTAYSGVFRLVPQAGDETYKPHADIPGQPVRRDLQFYPTDSTLYDYYNVYYLTWEYKINKNTKDVSIVPVPETLSTVYNGSERPVDYNITYPGNENIKQYSTVTYTSLDGQIVYPKAPSEAGSYRVTIRVLDNFPNYSGSLTTTLVIAKQTIDIAFAERYYFYNGESQGFGSLNFDGYAGDSGPIKYTIQYYRYTGVSMYDQVPSDVGRYIAKITITENNYQGTANINYYIIPSSITITNWNYVYDDAQKQIGIQVVPSGVSYSVRYRSEQRDDENNLIGLFSETRPKDAGRYQVRIIINENGYYKEIDVFSAVQDGINLTDPAVNLTIMQSYQGEYEDKVAEVPLTPNFPLFMRISKAYAVMTIPSGSQNRSVVYNGSGFAIVPVFSPSYLTAVYKYTPCEFTISDGQVVPTLVGGAPVPKTDVSDVVFDSYNRPVSVGFYVLTITLNDNDYQLGDYVKPTLRINPATLIIDTMPAVAGNVVYRQTEPVAFVPGTGQVRFAASGTTVSGIWQIVSDISSLKVGTYGNVTVRFIPMKNGKADINYIQPTGTITLTISKKDIGQYLYFTDNGVLLSWANGVEIHKAFTQQQISCTAWLDAQAAGIESSYNNGRALTIRIKYNGTYTLPTNVGTYAIVAELSDANYQGQSLAGTLIIDRAKPAIKAPSASPIPVGSALSESRLTSGLAYIAGSENENQLRSIAGTFSFRDPDLVMDKANYHKVWVVFTPSSLSTYDIALFQIEVRVLGIDVSVSGVSATSIYYGQPLSQSILTYTTSTVPGQIRWTDSTQIVDVGAKASYMFIPDNTDVYNIIYDGSVNIDIRTAEMSYNPDTLLIKGYVGETLGSAVNNIHIDLWHSLYPSLKVQGATYAIEDIADLNQIILNSKETYSCKLVVSHPNYEPLEILTQIRTYVYLGSENFYVANQSKKYDAEPVTLENLDIRLVGTEEQLDLSVFRMIIYKNGIQVSEMRDPGTYQVEILVFDDVQDEETSMTYDGRCLFDYVIEKKEFDGGLSEDSNLIHITGNNTVYGQTAGDLNVYYQYKKYFFGIARAGKVYDGAPLTAEYLGIGFIDTEDLPAYEITKIQRYNTSTSLYETVLSATMPGTYRLTISLVQNAAMGISDAPGASVVIPFTIYSSSPQGGIASDPAIYKIALYYPADESEIKLTYYSADKYIDYGQSAPVAAGSYIVRATFLSTHPFNQGGQEFPYTVTAMQIYVSLEAAYSFEFGEAIVINPMFTISPGSGNAMSNIGYIIRYYANTGTGWRMLDDTPVNAGSYKAQIILTGTNYVLAEGQGEVRMDITQLKVNITAVPVVSNLIYGQELYNAVISGGAAVLDLDGSDVQGQFFFKEPQKNDLPAGDRSVTLVFVPTNPNYAEAEISGVSIKILKAAASIESIQLTLPYNGLEQQPVIRTNPVSNLAVTYSYYQYINGLRQGVNKPKSAGTYEVVMKISDGNYEGSSTVSFTITKAVITDNDVVAPTVGALTYGQSLSYGAFVGGRAINPANNTEIAGSFRFTYTGLTLLGASVEMGGVSDNSNPYQFVPYVSPDGQISSILGTYYSMPYRFVPTDTANYEIYESTIEVVLMKASATITVYDSLSMKYGNVTSFVYGDTLPELTFRTSPLGLVVSNAQYMSSEGIFNKTPSAGTYMYTARINDANYTGELVYNVSINKRKAQIEFYDEDSQATTWYSYTYAATKAARARLLTASILPQDLQRISVIEAGLSYRYIKRDSSSSTVWRTLPENVGEYTVYAVLENEDYYIDSAAVRPNYDITKARVEYLDFDASTLINLVYGKVKVPTVVTRPANIAYTISFPGYESMPTTAGTHRIKVVVNDENFYPAEKTSMFYIYKKDITIDNIQVVNKPYDGTDIIAVSGTLTGLIVGDEVRLAMTARTKNGETEPGVYGVEILTWEISGLHASNYNVIPPVFNGTVKINQKVITDPKTSSYISCDEGFSSNVTVSFEKVYSAQNKSNFFSSLFGQTAIVQTISIKELGADVVLDKKVKFHVLIPEKYRNSPTLEVKPLGDLSQENIQFIREGDYMTFYADRSGEIIFYTNDFPYWIIVVGGGILMIIIGAFFLFAFAPVRRRKRIPGMARYIYGANQYAEAKAASRAARMAAVARRGRILR